MFGVMKMLDYVKEHDTTDGCDDQLMITSALRHEILGKEAYKELIKKYQ